MPETQCSVRYQASIMTPPLRQLTEDYGDCLELLSAAEKLHLLSILTLWQGKDTDLRNEEGYDQTYTLAEAIDDYPFELWGDVVGSLESLEGIAVDQVLDLMVALSNQLRSGVYQS